MTIFTRSGLFFLLALVLPLQAVSAADADTAAAAGALLDFGDAPLSYGTSFAVEAPQTQGGGDPGPARHDISGPGPWMGNGPPPDHEPDGLPTPGADGDDNTGQDDEDGVIFDPIVVGGGGAVAATDGFGVVAQMHVYVSSPGILTGSATTRGGGGEFGCWLNAWIDWGADGNFEPGDRVANDVNAAPDSVTHIPIFPPPDAVPGDTYARVRCSTQPGLTPVGFAADGEVEDYLITVHPPPWDFGDAPRPYPTAQPPGGGGPPPPAEAQGEVPPPPASHDITGYPVFLGSVRGDPEADGQPSELADGDDLDGTPDDEDGVVFDPIPVSPLLAVQGGGDPGPHMHVTVGFDPPKAAQAEAAGADGCFIHAWIDFGRDGSWFEVGDKVVDGTFVPASMTPTSLPIAVPPGAEPGTSYARVRCVADPGTLPPFGHQENGEVEDYLVDLVGDPGPRDFGDAPLPYPTAGPYLPASHRLDQVSVWMGTAGPPDAESDGQPSPLALGDDADGLDDEDGVVFSPLFIDEVLNAPATQGAGKGERYLEVSVSTGAPPASAQGDGPPPITGCLVSAWIDWDRDQSWLEPGDQVVDDQPVPAGGTVQFLVNPPFDATAGDTFARVRCSTEAGMAPHGPLPDGEVEDYRVTVHDAEPPEVSVFANANPPFVYAPGDDVMITVRVSNDGNEAFTINTLQDSMLGSLHGVGNCVLPQHVPGLDEYQCTYPATVEGTPGVNSRMIGAQVEDLLGLGSNAARELNIPIHPVPSATVIKTADPDSLPPGGGLVIYTLVVSNDNAAISNLQITSVEDDLYGTVPDTLGDCPPVPFVIGELDGADAVTYECSFKLEVTGPPDSQHVNVITVEFQDRLGTQGRDSGSATVTIQGDGVFEDSFEGDPKPPK